MRISAVSGKTRFLLGLCLFVGFAVVIWFFVNANQTVPDTDDAPGLPEGLETYIEGIKEISKIRRQDPQLASKKARDLLKQIPDSKTQRWVDLAINAGIEDIKLFGKVVDQFGNPLAGAKVDYEAAGKFYGTGSGFGHVFSDQSGHFVIEVFGSSLRIRDIEYPDAMYVGLIEEGTGNNKMYAKGNSFWSYQRYENKTNLQWTEYTPENPIVFDVWIADREVAKGNARDIRWGKRSIRTAYDGRPYTLDFVTTDSKLQFTEGVNDNGNIVVSCERDSMKERAERNTWKVTLQAVNGGIQRSGDRYLNLAPETGYLPMVEVGRTVSQPNYHHELYDQRYYFQSSNGDYYGTLFIDYRPFNMPYDFKTEQYEEQFCLLSIEFKINTAGDRYLFKDKNLLAKKFNTN